MTTRAEITSLRGPCSLVDLRTGGGASLTEIEGATAVWGASAARLRGVESVSSRHHTNGTMKITVATLSGGSITFDVAAPGASEVVDRVTGVVVVDPLVTGVATTASGAALALLDTSAHAFAGPYASSAGLRVPPPPLLDDRVVRFFGSDEPVGDALSGLGRGAGASLSAVSRGSGASLSRLMALLEGGSCDRGALCFESCSLSAAVLAPRMPTVSDDCTAVALAWHRLTQRDHKKKKEREAFQMQPIEDDEEAPAFVGRVLGMVETSKRNSFYKTLANAIGKADLATAARNDAVLKALDGVSAADLLIIGSLPESSDASGGGGALVGGLSVPNDAVDATPLNGGFTDQDRKDLQWFRQSKKFTKQRLEAAYKRHGLPSWTTFNERKAANDLAAHLEKLLADAADSDSEEDDSEVEADTTRGSGTEASLEEFGRVLGKFVRFKGAANIVVGEDFLSRKLLSYIPTEDQDLEEDIAGTSTQPYKASDLTSASDVLAERFDEVVALLDVASLGALTCVSHAGAAVVPIREADSVWIRRASTTNDEATPATFQSFLLQRFLPFGAANTPREERVEKARALAVKMLLRAEEITVKEDVEVGHTPWQIIRDGAANSRYSYVEFSQLRKAVDERHALFRDYKASDVSCTVNTNIKVALEEKLLDQYLRRLLRDQARKQELEAVASKPSAHVAVTLATSLSTYVDLSSKRQAAFMDPKVKLKTYGNARTHSTPAAIKIIREATDKIDVALEELSKDFPGRRDAAVKYLLSLPDFQPKTSSEREQFAAVHTWLNDPRHVREVERAAAGEKKKKRKKRAEQGRAKTKFKFRGRRSKDNS